MNRALRLAAIALLVAGCGKDPNLHEASFLEFPNALPAAPEMLDAPSATPWTSGRSLAVTEDAVFAVDRVNGHLVILDRADLAVAASVDVGASPAHVVVGPEGSAWVSVRGEGVVAQVDTASATVTQRVEVGGEPLGIALSPDGSVVYVGLHTTGEIVVLDAASGAELQRRATGGMLLRGLAATADHVVVTQQAGPAFRLNVLEPGGELALAKDVPLRVGSPSDFVFTPDRVTTLRATRAIGAAVHPSTGVVYMAHVQAQPGSDEEALSAQASQAEVQEAAPTSGYGSSSSVGSTLSFDVPARPVEVAITSVDATGNTGEAAPALPVQDRSTGMPLTALVDQPSDANHHPTWSLLFVVGEGSDSVVVFNTAVTDVMSAPVAVIRTGMGPLAVAFSPDGMHAYILNGHGFTVGEVDLAPLMAMPAGPQKAVAGIGALGSRGFEVPFEESFDEPALEGDAFVEPIGLTQTREVAFGDDPRSDAVRRGERTFTFSGNERLSHAGQFACATCHLEGTEDKLVWFITDGPRQTISLAGRLADTAPFNWTGTKPVLQENMQQTIARMGGTGLTEAELADLEAFMIHELRAPANPHMGPEGMDAQAQFGQTIFEDPAVGCATCHAGAALTDGNLYDVGSSTPVERTLRQAAIDQGEELPPPGFFNTPSLRGLWYTAPYLHNGRAATLYDVLEMTEDRMGHTSHLTGEEKDALVAYLRTL